MTVRNTRAKTTIKEIFSNSHIPLDINEVLVCAKKSVPKIAFSTVFRNIQKLITEGSLIKVDWRERNSKYEWADRIHHHHLICNSCGAVADISDKFISFKNKDISKKTGFEINDHSIELYGKCSPCQTSHI